MRRWLPTVGALATVGCGPGLVEQADMLRLCGQEGPVEVLSIPAERRVASIEVQEATDRLVVTTGTLEDGTFGGSFPTGSPETWSVGACGESPVRVARGLTPLLHNLGLGDQPPPWAGADAGTLLACDQDLRDVYVIDVTGDRMPQVLFPGGCGGAWIGSGMVVRNQDAGSLELFPAPADPWAGPVPPKDLLDGLGASQPVVVGGEVFVLTADHALLRIALPDGASTRVTDDAWAFSANEKWVIWQTTEVVGETQLGPKGPIIVRDRSTGQDIALGDGVLACSAPPLLRGFPTLCTRPFDQGGERVFDRLPSAEFIEVDAGEEFLVELEPRRWVVGTVELDRLWVEDFDTGERTVFFEGEGAWSVARNDQSWTIADLPPVGRNDWLTGEGPVWDVRFDGTRTKLADRATRPSLQLHDGRLVTRVDVGGSGLGTMVVVDPDTRQESVIDDAVDLWPSTRPPWQDDLFYGHIDGSDSGLRRARLAPR